MVKTRGRDGSIVRHGHPGRGVSISRHGQLAIDIRCISYFGLSAESDGGSPHDTLHFSSLSSSIPSLSPYLSTPSSLTPSSKPHTVFHLHFILPTLHHHISLLSLCHTLVQLTRGGLHQCIMLMIQSAPPPLFLLVIIVGVHHSSPPQLPLCSQLLLLLYITLLIYLYRLSLLPSCSPPLHPLCSPLLPSCRPPLIP